MESEKSPSVGHKRRSESRRRVNQIKVRVSCEEQSLIEANAKGSGLGMAEFLRRLGQGHILHNRLDQLLIRDLCTVAGDLGRLGGLIKAWMVEKRAGTLPAGGPSVSQLNGLYQELREACALIKKKASEI